MTQVKSLLWGNASFFIGYIIVLLSEYILIPLLTAVELANMWQNNWSGIIWIGFIITTILAFIVVPIGLMIHGIISSEGTGTGVMGIGFAFLWAFFTLAITFFAWYMTTGLVSVIVHDITKIAFWAGLIGIYILNLVGVPAYSIIKAKS